MVVATTGLVAEAAVVPVPSEGTVVVEDKMAATGTAVATATSAAAPKATDTENTRRCTDRASPDSLVEAAERDVFAVVMMSCPCDSFFMFTSVDNVNHVGPYGIKTCTQLTISLNVINENINL